MLAESKSTSFMVRKSTSFRALCLSYDYDNNNNKKKERNQLNVKNAI